MSVKNIYAAARNTPDRIAVIWNGRPVTYRRFAQVIETSRSTWAPIITPAGGIAVLVVHSLLECWPSLLALQQLGLTTVCATSLEAAHKLRLPMPVCLVVCQHKARSGMVVPDEWSKVPRLRPLGDLTTEPAFSQALSEPVGTGSHILYTSGTTGSYKKLLIETTQNPARQARRLDLEDLDAQTVWNSVFFGPWTGEGYKRPLLIWHAGGTVVFDQRSDWPRHLGEFGVTHSTLTPAMATDALKTLRQTAMGQPRWSFSLNVGGAPVSKSLASELLAYVTPELFVIFGATELSTQPLRSRISHLEDLSWIRPVGDRVVEVVDDQERPCPPGIEGRLRFRLDPLDCSGYLNDPEATARVFRDGWFYPGDLAVRRADGCIRVLGRAADVVNVGGSKIATGLVEERLREQIGIANVCLFAGLDAADEEVLIVAIEIERRLEQAKIDALMPHLPVARNVRFVQMKRFPSTQNGTGKVDRIALRKQVLTLRVGAEEII